MSTLAATVSSSLARGFLGISSIVTKSENSASKELGATKELVNNMSELITQILVQMISTRSAEEFRKLRNEVFDVYLSTLKTLHGILLTFVPSQSIEVLAAQSFSRLESEIKDQADEMFGSVIAEQMAFTVWSFRRTSALTNLLIASPLPPEHKEENARLANDFSSTLAWAQLHMQCLTTAMDRHQTIYPEVLVEISEELRSAVDAYALARTALGLRSSLDASESHSADGALEGEELELLNESALDMAHEEW